MAAVQPGPDIEERKKELIHIVDARCKHRDLYGMFIWNIYMECLYF
jgi:hypothetical protein